MDVLPIDAEGARVLHDYLWIRQLRVAPPGVRAPASVLGVECDIQTAQPNGSSGPLILCSRPRENGWTLAHAGRLPIGAGYVG